MNSLFNNRNSCLCQVDGHWRDVLRSNANERVCNHLFPQRVNGPVRLKLQRISFMIELLNLLFILRPVDREDDSGTSQLDRFVSNTCFKKAHSTF